MIPFAVIAQECAPTIAPETLHVIVKQESGFNPFAIGVNGGQLERQPTNAAEAIATAKALLADGFQIDLGYGQISTKNRERLGITLEQAFDGCTNLKHAAMILQDNYKRALALNPDPQEALRAALSMYNTGSATAGLKNGYVGKLLAHAEQAQKQGVQVPAIQPIRLKSQKQDAGVMQSTATDSTRQSRKASPSQEAPGTEQQPHSTVLDKALVYGQPTAEDDVMVYSKKNGESAKRPPGRQ